MEFPQSADETNHKILDSDAIVDCPICLESFEEITDPIVICGCGNKICLPCAKQCLLNTEKDPHCINCKRGWDRAFQYDNFGNSWINRSYKKYRKNLLLEREKARMPETQPHVEAYMKLNDYKNELKELIEIENDIRDAYYKAQFETNQIRRKIRLIENGSNIEEVEKKKFVMKCPNDECRGFLSTAYKCDLCKVFVCAQCHEVKGHTKDAEHECDPNSVETIKQLKKDTKPCPACSTPIFKISGCDQMWCTQCKVAFSWNRGTIEKGIVHNPHYYQWMKANENNVQNPGAQACGGIPSYYEISRSSSNIQNIFNTDNTRTKNLLKQYTILFEVHIDRIDKCRKVELRKILMHIHRSTTHNLHTIINTLREAVNGAINNQDLRIRYLANEIDEKHLAKMVTQRDNIREKKLAMLQVLELFNNVMTDFLIRVASYQHNPKLTKKDVDTLHNSIVYLYKTRVYCNIELMKIAKNYKMKVHYIQAICIINSKLVTYKEIEEAINDDKLIAQKSNLGVADSYKDL